MKLFLRKINRGVALMLVIILAVVVYLAVEASAANAYKSDIKMACEEYLKDYTALSVLPEKYHVVKTPDETKAFDAYMDSVRETMYAHYLDKPEKLRQTDITPLVDFLVSQSTGGYVFTELKRNIQNFDSIVFDGDYATADVKLEIKYTTRAPSGETSTQAQTGLVDTLLLKKIDKGWKIVSTRIMDVHSHYDINQGIIEKKMQTERYVG